MRLHGLVNLLRVAGIVMALVGCSLMIASLGIFVGKLAFVSSKSDRVTVTIEGVSMSTGMALGAGIGLVLLGIVALYYSGHRTWRLVGS